MQTKLQTTDATSPPCAFADRLLGCPCIIGPRSKLAEEEEFRPLMTDFASGPFDREPPALDAGRAGFGAAAATDVSGVSSSETFARSDVSSFATGAEPMTLSQLLRSVLPPRLLAFDLVRPPNAMADDDVMGVDMDKADFLSFAIALSAMAAEDFSPVDCASTDFASDLAFVLAGTGAGVTSCTAATSCTGKSVAMRSRRASAKAAACRAFSCRAAAGPAAWAGESIMTVLSATLGATEGASGSRLRKLGASEIRVRVSSSPHFRSASSSQAEASIPHGGRVDSSSDGTPRGGRVDSSSGGTGAA